VQLITIDSDASTAKAVAGWRYEVYPPLPKAHGATAKEQSTMTGQIDHTETSDGITYTLSIEKDDQPVRGNV
jgi:hypothetical protein